MDLTIRIAVPDDIPALHALIALSVRALQANDYTQAQMDGALGTVFGVDSQLIADETFFIAETPHREPGEPEMLLVGCGGWSKRKTLCGSDAWEGREDTLLDPCLDAAKIRAFFIHPDWARRGIGSRILETCENAAVDAGFTRFEMGATLTGVPLYLSKGYTAVESRTVPLVNGEMLPIVFMEKRLLL
jgi:GNAT superfamily N-acetyltransferase